MSLQFLQTETLSSWGLDIIFNVLPSPVYVLSISLVHQSPKPVCNLNLILFSNLQLIAFWDSVFPRQTSVLLVYPLPISLNSATTRQWSVSQSAPLKLRTSSALECQLYQCVIILVVSLPIKRGPGVLWMFWCGNIVLLTTRICDVAKFISVVWGRVNLSVPSASHVLHCVCLLVPFVR